MEELGSILKFLENRSILVTGFTGFLGKMFVEKILRVQPKVKRLFLLIRATDIKTATQRLHNEVIGKEVFKIVREKYGEGFDAFISEKIMPVAGDIADENLGIVDSKTREAMWREITVIVNLAATTNFKARYDVALSINTLGAKNVLDFAKQCAKTDLLMHVSTAYVCGDKSGLLVEKPFHIGETLNGSTGLDIQKELSLANETLEELRSQKATKDKEKVAMKELGLQRARMYGWPNTYVFTKALGEMLIGHFKENIPVATVRPTIITSTYKDPFPGWIEGIRTLDFLTVGYGKGKLGCFLGDPDCILDVIPADMVVNAIIVAIVASANQPSLLIYQVGSSMRNPLNPFVLREYGYSYFSKHPWIQKNGNPVRVSEPIVLTSMDSFRRYMNIRYVLPLKVFELLNIICCRYFERICAKINRNIKFAFDFVDIYKSYIFFKGRFDDLNTERLRVAVREAGSVLEADAFNNFDPECIDWDDYFMNAHIPGVVKFCFQMADT
ncbi:hypothetical protein Sjap_001198 [Stephania japonica]|uniref:Fatty acyl-CoA reductase n=1 Tax=Stephania japonica TaxID=461633 RepID=A0AAP0KJI1_9MAGN